MRKITHVFTAPILAVLLIVCSGCGAVIVGGLSAAGTYVYLDGQSEATYDASLSRAYKASLRACKDLGIPVTTQTMDGASAKVEGKLSGDTVILSLKLVGDGLTQITVRVGLLGNENQSRRIHNAIKKHL